MILLGTLLCAQDLDAYNFFHHPDIVCLSIDYPLEVLQAISQVLHFPVVEISRIVSTLLNKEASADVDEHVCGRGEATRHV